MRVPVADKPNGVPGPGVDASGRAARDPTDNVIDMLDAAVRRLDDLRDAESRHIRELASQRVDYDEKQRNTDRQHAMELREAESKRIDAIRAVDVGAVNRAAEVQAAQALTLATQQTTSADTLRNQVATTAAAFDSKLATALEPIIKDIRDLRASQSESVGQKTQIVERRGSNGLLIAAGGFGISFVLALIVIVGLILGNQ